jgi:hypothetical protein
VGHAVIGGRYRLDHVIHGQALARRLEAGPLTPITIDK